MEIVKLIIVSFYFILPAYLANMAPVIFGKLGWLNFLAKPIDGGGKMGGEFIFGSGKTWRGIVSAVILAIVVTAVQAVLFKYQTFNSISLIDYPHLWLVFGFLAGLGAILGDLIKSFFKRRVNISSGRPWIIFDQLDFIAGFFLFTWVLAWPSWRVVLIVIVLTLILHPLTNISAYWLHMKKVWW